MNRTVFARECLCEYLQTLAAEQGFTLERMAVSLDKKPEEVAEIFRGNSQLSLDDILDIVHLLSMELTVIKGLSFSHKKITVTHMHGIFTD
jgi:hypothetical protein